MNLIFNKEDWNKALGTKEEFEKAQQERENDETEKIMSLCITCNGRKVVNLIEDEDLTVPCPTCNKEFYDK